MAGVYIHIPFCKQACHYCNFHFSTSVARKTDMVAALLHELEMRSQYLPTGEPLGSIYFGGGTPSLLNAAEIEQLIGKTIALFGLKPDAEITLEANPDDLSENKLWELRQIGVNRLSIGIQSFFEPDLLFMNRAHNAGEALNCIELALKTGFTNLSIDFIYGTPTLTNEQWQRNLAIAFGLNIPHISAYCLTVEPKTALHSFIKKGKIAPLQDEHAQTQFNLLTQNMAERGYQHYEISNFCLPGHIAVHNSSYWNGAHYLGIGPSAHSYNGVSRSWNVANNALYLKAIQQNNLPAETEMLTPKNRFNEYIMTALRTMWGADLTYLSAEFGEEKTRYLLNQAQRYVQQGKLQMVQNRLLLAPDARFIADAIIAHLFWD